MTEIVQADAQAIARGLTEAQRRMVLASPPGGWGRDDTACGAELIGSGAWATARALNRRGLGDWAEHPGYYPSGLYFNNERGLEVRSILENE